MDYDLEKNILAENGVATAHYIKNGSGSVAIISKNKADINFFETSYRSNESFLQLAKNVKRLLDVELSFKPVYYSAIYNLNNDFNTTTLLIIPRYNRGNDIVESHLWDMIELEKLTRQIEG